MRIQDRFTGETMGVIEYNPDSFFIAKKDRDASYDDTFKFEDSILRPSHLIALHGLIEEFENVLVGTQPVILIDGKERIAKTYRAPSFKELYDYIEKYLEDTPVPVLYMVFRQQAIDTDTFEPKLNFAIRLFE